MPNLPTDSYKKLPTVGGVGVKNRETYANVSNGWSLKPNSWPLKEEPTLKVIFVSCQFVKDLNDDQ